MSAEPTPEATDDVMVVTADEDQEPSTAPDLSRIQFLMPQPEGEEPHVLTAVRPKNILLMVLGEKLDAAEEPNADDGVKMDAYRAFITGAIEDKSALHLWNRLGTPDDALDSQHLHAMARQLMERWTARPTVRPAGSRSLPRTTGRPSTGRSRSTAKTPKT